jgi:hypothetical protein
MSGIRQGFLAEAKANDPQAVIFDCLIHMGNHASRKVAEKMDTVNKRGHSSCKSLTQ